MSDYLCNDCLDTGWIEDREGKTVCACISETEPYQLLLAEVEALKVERAAFIDAVRWLPARITDQLREYKPATMQIVDAALRGEGEK